MDRLTNIVKPNKIFMGEKDFQQLFLVKKYLNENKFLVTTAEDAEKCIRENRNN